METNKIYNIDVLEGLKQLEDNSIDLIITSPPYNIGKMHSNHIQFGTYAGNDMDEKEYQDWQVKILDECFRVLKQSGSMFYNHKVRIKNGLAIHPLEWVSKSKFLLKQELVWNQKKSANSDKIRFFPYTERIYWLVKNKDVKANNKLSLSDCWDIVPTNKRKDNNHIAVMPEKVVENILSAFEGKIVLDIFSGYATTLLVAKQKGREFIGFEINPEFIKIAEERLTKLNDGNDGIPPKDKGMSSEELKDD